MLEFDLVICFISLVVVAYFESYGIKTKKNSANGGLIEINKFLVGNKRLYVLPFFLFISIITDLELQSRSGTSSIVLLYFFLVLVILFFLDLKRRMTIESYFGKVRFLYKELGKLGDKENKEKIGLKKQDLIFLLNEVILNWILLLTASFIIAKCIYYLTN